MQNGAKGPTHEDRSASGGPRNLKTCSDVQEGLQRKPSGGRLPRVGGGAAHACTLQLQGGLHRAAVDAAQRSAAQRRGHADEDGRPQDRDTAARFRAAGDNGGDAARTCSGGRPSTTSRTRPATGPLRRGCAAPAVGRHNQAQCARHAHARMLPGRRPRARRADARWPGAAGRSLRALHFVVQPRAHVAAPPPAAA
jgi:hypothetical protein